MATKVNPFISSLNIEVRALSKRCKIEKPRAFLV